MIAGSNKMTEGQQAAKSAVIITIAMVLSKLFGFVRLMVIAAYFGASFTTDAYLVATIVPMVIFSIVNSSLTTTFIPVFTETLYKEGKEEAFKLASIILNIVLIVGVIITIIGIYLAPQIISLTAPGFKGEVAELSLELTRIMFPMVIFLGLAGIVSGILNSFKSFAIPALVGIPQNIIIILSVITLGKIYGIYGLAAGTAVGFASQLFFQLPTLKKLGIRYHFSWNLKNPGIKKIGLLIVPIIFGSVATQLNIVVNRIMASGLPEGSISALNFASRLNGAALGIAASAICTVIYPLLSQYSATCNQDRFRKVMATSINICNMIVIPLSVAIIIMRVPLVSLLFERGAFNAGDTQATAYALLYYTIGMAALALQLILGRVFYSLQDTRTPMFIGIFTVAVNICLSLILVKPLAHGGLAFATSISAIIGVILLLYFLWRKLGNVDGKLIYKSLTKVTLSSAIMGLSIYLMNTFIFGNFEYPGTLFKVLHLATLGVSGLIIYLLSIRGLGTEELKIFMDLLSPKILSKFRKTPS